MGKMASAASALLAPCPRSAFLPAIPVPRILAVMVSAMMRPEGEDSPQLLNPCCVPAHGYALTAFPSRFRCVCEPGWSGPRCSQSLARDACESQPCRSGGTCTSDGMGFHCTCPPGVQGVCPHIPTPGSPSPLLPAHFLSAPLPLVYIWLFSPFPPLSSPGDLEVGNKVGTLEGDWGKGICQDYLTLPAHHRSSV